MALKQSTHIIRGMQRDLSVARFNPEFAFDCQNIRMTARENNTLLTVTNEKGNLEIQLTGVTSLEGTPLGYCVIKDYIVLFTSGATDHIYRIHKEGDNYVVFSLFNGNLNFNTSYPIQTLASYENENIQKVYWVDGLNQARVVNIITNVPYTIPDIFNFVRNVSPNSTITVTKELGGGIFAAGVIQYALSYYVNHAQESTIFYSSPLYYISSGNRAGSPEEICTCRFRINIDNPDRTFDGVNIYSIHRTSINATPTVKLVTSLSLKSGEQVFYVDSGSSGSTIDPTELLYKGGEEITPYTIAQKDNTLFLGNLVISRSSIPEELRLKIATIPIVSSNKESVIINNTGNVVYPYEGYLSYNSEAATTFKTNEVYRLGIIALHKTGKWSEAIPVSDKLMTSTVQSIGDQAYALTEFDAQVPVDLQSSLAELGYVALKPVVVFPDYYDRNVICQGVLNPTLSFSRKQDSAFAISSWFSRPKIHSTDSNLVMDTSQGSITVFKHEDYVSSETKTPNTRWSEIQCGPEVYVNENIITLSSPDIEFDDTVRTILENTKLRIVGYTVSDANAIDYSIIGSPYFRIPSTLGFEYSVVKYDYSKSYKGAGHRRLITAGLWRDGIVTEVTPDSGNISDSSINKLHAVFSIYPWHRGTSLNNDWARDGRTANLQKKVMSTLVYTDTNYFAYNNQYDFESDENNNRNGISGILVYNSTEEQAVRLPIPKYSGITSGRVYQGNYSGVLTPIMLGYYSIDSVYYSNNLNDPTFYNDGSLAINTNLNALPHEILLSLGSVYTRTTSDSCEVKFKSTPHAVAMFNNTSIGSAVLLPSVGNFDTAPAGYIMVEDLPTPITTVTIKYWSEAQPVGGSIGDYWFKTISGSLVVGALYKCVSSSGLTWGLVTDPGIGLDTLYTFGDSKYYLSRTSTGSDYTYTMTNRTLIPKYYKDDLSSYFSSLSGEHGILWLAELYRDNVVNRFGGNTESAYENNLWLPSGKTIKFTNYPITLRYIEGDTFYQRYDHLKTYPFDNSTKNNMVEILSFMCETRVNIDGRYDNNRGLKNNLGITPQNFNLLNPVYSQKDNFFTYRFTSLDLSSINEFPTTVTWTNEKINGANTDAWTNITLASTLDMDGDKGEVTSINSLNNELFCFQEQGFSNIIFNPRVQIPASDGMPIEITNNYKVQGKRYISNTVGCNNKWSICRTSNGLYFVDNRTTALYLFNGEGIVPLSTKLGFRQFIADNNSLEVWNPVDFGNFITYYDKTNDDIYFINNRYCLCYSETLNQFTSFMSYEQTPIMFNYEDKFFSVKNNKLWEQNAGDYNMFFGSYQPYSITVISNAEEQYDKIFNTVEFRADAYDGSNLAPTVTYDTLDVYTEYQHGHVALTNILGHPSPLKRKFRIWRATIPRANTPINGVASNNKDRIRNPWAYIKLSMNTPNTYRTEFYDMTIGYFA